MSTTHKISLSLSADLVHDLDVLSARLGVSRSAIISSVLAGPLRAARETVEMVPVNPAPADQVVRMRGESVEVVQARLASLLRVSNDLFASN